MLNLTLMDPWIGFFRFENTCNLACKSHFKNILRKWKKSSKGEMIGKKAYYVLMWRKYLRMLLPEMKRFLVELTTFMNEHVPCIYGYIWWYFLGVMTYGYKIMRFIKDVILRKWFFSPKVIIFHEHWKEIEMSVNKSAKRELH